MSRCVIAAFKPKPGMQHALLAVVEKHWRVLQAQGLVTDRPRYAMQAGDGTIVEVFEWRSAEAIEQAAARSVRPEVFERHGARREGSRRYAEHGLLSAERQSRGHDALPAADELSVHALARVERVHLDGAPRGRPVPNDEEDLGAGDRDARRIALALVHA